MNLNLNFKTDTTQTTELSASLFGSAINAKEGSTSFASILSEVQSSDRGSEKKNVSQPKVQQPAKSINNATQKAVATKNHAAQKAASRNETVRADAAQNTADLKDAKDIASAQEAARQDALDAAATQTGETKTAATVTVQDLIKTLNLNDEQVSKLATAMGVTPEELKKIQITLDSNNTENTPSLTAVSPDGQRKDLSQLLGLGANNTPTDGKQALQKISDILGLDKKQSADFFSALNITSMEVKGTKDIAQTAGQAEQAILPQQALQIDPAILPQKPQQAEQANLPQQPLMKTAPLSVAQASMAAALPNAQADNNGGTGNSGSQLQAGIDKGIVEQTRGNTENAKVDFAAALDKAATNTATTQPNTAQTVTSAPVLPVKAADAVSTAGKTQGARIMGQIVEKATILNFPSSTETRITLSPESLGTVDIKLSMTDANVKASIMVESHAVKQVVEQNLDQLKTSLHQQGIMVEEMSVFVGQQGGRSFDSNTPGGRELPGISGVSGEQKIAEPVARGADGGRRRASNSTVDITA